MADIVLRDRNGNQVEYPGVESIKLNTVGGGTKEFIDPDTVPQAVEKTIDPDFSAGDMEVIPEDGQVFSKVGISKPSNLLPGNIAEGVDIAGVVGNLASIGGEKTISFTKVLTLNYEPPSNSFVSPSYYAHQILSASELATAGIDLTQYNKWYAEGQSYVPVIYLQKLNKDNVTTNPYDCIDSSYISNIPKKPSSGQNTNIGAVSIQYASGYFSGVYSTINVKTESEQPLNQRLTHGLSVDLSGNVNCYVYSYKNGKSCLNGTYMLVVLLAPLL